MDRCIRTIRLILRRWKLQTLSFYLGILGLGTAFSVLILTWSYFRHEFQYDQHIPGNERIYLLSISNGFGKMTPANLAMTLEDNISGINSSTVFDLREKGFYHQESKVLTTRAANVSPTFYEVFDLKFRHGSKPDTIQPTDIFITESCAYKFFGKTDVIGQTLSTKDDIGYLDSYTIRGVMQDFPENSSIKADIFYFDYFSLKPDFAYGKPTVLTYGWIVLDRHISLEQVQNQLSAFYQAKEFPEEFQVEFTVLSELHFSNHAELQQVFYATSARLVIILGSVTLLILIIAGINYINLSMAQSLEYVKQVGIRKTLGATDRQVINQFFIDTLSHFVTAIPLAYLFAWLIAPLFFDFLSIPTTPEYIFHIETFIIIFLVAAAFSTLCGLYPAFMLINKKTNQLLHYGKHSFGVNLVLRKTLMVAQYALSITLIILSIGIQKQVSLLQNRPLGFDKEQLIVLPDVSLRAHYQSFKNELLSNPNIVSVTSSNLHVGSRVNRSQDTTRHVETIIGDFDLIKTLGLELISGNGFDANDAHHRKYTSDYMLFEPGKEEEFRLKLQERPILVSQDLVAYYGLSDPIGEVFKDEDGKAYGRIVGVVKPFESGPQQQQNSLKVLYGEHEPFYSGNLYVRIANHQIHETLKHIEKVWKTRLSNHEFTYSFVDERIDNLYKSEKRLTWVIITLTVISCILSILGALGLLALTLNQRVQEIGIRKVLGASVGQIVVMMMRDSVKPIMISMLIAFPLGWWAINKWLEDFAYRIEVSWMIFALSGVMILGITVLAMSVQTARAAGANPVDSLRDE